MNFFYQKNGEWLKVVRLCATYAEADQYAQVVANQQQAPVRYEAGRDGLRQVNPTDQPIINVPGLAPFVAPYHQEPLVAPTMNDDPRGIVLPPMLKPPVENGIEAPMMMPTINWAEVQHTMPTGGLGMGYERPAPRYDGAAAGGGVQTSNEEPLALPSWEY